MSRLFAHFRRYIPALLLQLVAIFLMVAATLELPDAMARVINQGVLKHDNALIWRAGGLMLLLALGAAAASAVSGLLAARIATGFARDVREAVFAKVESFSLAEFHKFSTASLITRSTNDVQQLQMVLVMLLRMALMAPFMGVWAIIKAYRAAPSMTWIMGLAIAILVSFIAALFGLAIPRYRRLQTLVDKLNLVTREILTGLRVIRAFNRERFEEAKFDGVNSDLMRLNLTLNRLMMLMQPVMLLTLNLAVLAIVWSGAHLIDLSRLQVGDMLAFMQYAMQAIMGFLLLTFIFMLVPRASVSGGRIAEVLNTEITVVDPASPAVPPKRGGRVDFDRVTFAYAGAEEPVLRDVSFTALPGQTTAIVGSTGSGKSTLINLIPRLYDPTRGTVCIDGADVRSMRLEDVYARIGYVPQRGILFSGTVESNIRYGAPEAPQEALDSAVEIAQAREFVETTPEGYVAPISQRGTNVSGGQRQRLSIARAIVRDPEIYIFDDSFSALDFRTDAMLRQALRGATRDKTVIIVAQRIGTIINADKIVVLDEGRIVGEGTHRELMETCEVYREIALSQLSERELAGGGRLAEVTA
ncbi:MAG TPA: ABC transporter ATP-binding protein [Thermoanaerobaculia bacterium]|jgi:ATP-binding cassette subfamily B protein|nr:ABC transporter ATP-binding protein [Thermoanaerobaculia bacterium]